MGEHRNSGGGRSVAAGPVVVLVVIVVVIAAVFGWFRLRDWTAEQGVAAAEQCVEGSAVLAVTVDPDISGAVDVLADRYNATAPVVRDRCVRVDVRAVASDAAREGLESDTWDSTALGPKPALWIPQSGLDVGGLDEAGSLDGTPRPTASSPVVLAAPPPVADALTGAGVAWGDLVRVQQDPDALGLPDWGGLRLHLPLGPETGPTTMIAAAVAAATIGDASGAVPAEAATSPPVVDALSRLTQSDRGGATSASTTYDALTSLENSAGPEAEFHTVAVTEQQLSSTNSATLVPYSPSGPTPVADHPAAILAGDWVDETSSRAAAAFSDFLRQGENTGVFEQAGFRAPDAVPSNRIDAAVPNQIDAAVPSRTVVAALTQTLANPVLPRRATVLLDVSGSMDTSEGGGTRLENTVRALNTEFARVPDTTELGLWSYSADLGGQTPYRIDVPTGPVSDDLGGTPRRSALETRSAALTSESATSTFTSLLDGYRAAVDGYVPGRPNSLVLITDGPDDEGSITPEALLRDLAGTVDPVRPVAVTVITIGDNPDAPTLVSVAESTGGSFAVVPSSDDPLLQIELGKLLY